jgi:flagellar biosynthesis/type III secretory pathway M-ring protein FliF/YscJ
MAFDHSYAVSEQQKQASSDQTDLYIRIGQVALGVLALLILGIVLMRMFSNLRKTTSTQWKPVLRPVGEMALAAGAAGASMAVGPGLPQALQAIAAGEKQPILAASEDVTPQQQIQSRIQDLMPARSATQTAEDEQLQALMRSLTEENPATVAEVIQMWLNEG